jgi:putative transposase
MPPRRPGRLRAFDYTGRWRYFLTACTDSRRPIFRDAAVVESVLGHFLRFAARDGFEIIAHCFMPDHAHFLVQGTRLDAHLPRFMNSAKQHLGYGYAKATGVRLWDKGYYDRVLRDSEATEAVARYILMNPVRAGLVKSAADYPFLGSSVVDISSLISTK